MNTRNDKPFNQAAENNKRPIVEVLRGEFSRVKQVLEIGSGTGQHAVFFAAQLPHLCWQTSDVRANHGAIRAWLDDTQLPNVVPPLELDVAMKPWPIERGDGVFSANTVHIMSWPHVEEMFAGIGHILSSGGVFCLYGPFNYRGAFTSESNARFDQWLKSRDPRSGIRDFEALDSLARAHRMLLHADHTMPVNNRLLVWHKVETARDRSETPRAPVNQG